MKTDTVILLGAIGIGGYLLYKYLNKGVNYVEDKTANAYTDITDWIAGRHDIQATIAGAAVFPSGARVPLSNLTVTPFNGPNGFEARITYQGRTYSLSPHDASGNYPATLV